jgi:hypothetical protein
MKSFPVKLTMAQKQALRDHAKAHNMSMADVILYALADTIPDFPMDKPTPGGWRDNEKSLENLVHYVDKLTDYGKNDPTE